MRSINDEAIWTIRAYFAGEGGEQALLLAFCAILLVTAIALPWRGDHFARGFAAGLLLTATTGGAASIPLLIRDKGYSERLIAHAHKSALVDERDRIAKVISQYPTYRYAYLAAAVLALCALLIRPSEFLTGLGAGLIVLSSTGFVVDHFSERRAKVYAAGLDRVISGMD